MTPQPHTPAQTPLSERQITEQHERGVLVKVLRGIFLVLLAIVTAVAMIRESTQSQIGFELVEWWWLVALGVAAFFVVIVGVDILTPNRKLSAITAILFGCFAGLITTALLGLIIDYIVATHLEEPLRSSNEFQGIVSTVKVILGLGLCYIGITTVLQTQNDFRLVIPYVEFAKQYRGTKPLLLDTSSLIDGRIMDVAEVGCFQAPIIVPRFVIDELQTLSDSGEKLKRARGRRGLDLLSRMQRSALLDVTIDDARAPGAGVDQMIVEMAQAMPAVVVTTDVGLARVATIHGVSVLNLNDLANALKPNVVPGQSLDIELIRQGEQEGQGVGYLDDGTMVVAENASDHVGRRVTLIVTSAMQTSAGRLIFGRVERGDAEAPRPSAEASIPPASDGAEHDPEPDASDADARAIAAEILAEAGAEPAPPHAPAGPLGPHRKKKAPGTPRNPRRS
jgi:uncharacterized protein YacL